MCIGRIPENRQKDLVWLFVIVFGQIPFKHNPGVSCLPAPDHPALPVQLAPREPRERATSAHPHQVYVVSEKLYLIYSVNLRIQKNYI